VPSLSDFDFFAFASRSPSEDVDEVDVEGAAEVAAFDVDAAEETASGFINICNRLLPFLC